jgi:hypothetical protein
VQSIYQSEQPNRHYEGEAWRIVEGDPAKVVGVATGFGAQPEPSASGAVPSPKAPELSSPSDEVAAVDALPERITPSPGASGLVEWMLNGHLPYPGQEGKVIKPGRVHAVLSQADRQHIAANNLSVLHSLPKG